jgi:hypothetical protein
MRKACPALVALCLLAVTAGAQQPPTALPGQGHSYVLLLREPDVGRELNLTAEQTVQLQGLYTKQKLGQRQALNAADPQAALAALNADMKKEIFGVLTPAQATRLRQLELQYRGHTVMIDPEVARELGLTNQQRDRIAASTAKLTEKLALVLKDRKGDEKSMYRIIAEVQRRAFLEAVQELTPAQRARWQALTGEPFRGMFPNGFGPHVIKR